MLLFANRCASLQIYSGFMSQVGPDTLSHSSQSPFSRLRNALCLSRRYCGVSFPYGDMHMYLVQHGPKHISGLISSEELAKLFPRRTQEDCVAANNLSFKPFRTLPLCKIEEKDIVSGIDMSLSLWIRSLTISNMGVDEKDAPYSFVRVLLPSGERVKLDPYILSSVFSDMLCSIENKHKSNMVLENTSPSMIEHVVASLQKESPYILSLVADFYIRSILSCLSDGTISLLWNKLKADAPRLQSADRELAHLKRNGLVRHICTQKVVVKTMIELQRQISEGIADEEERFDTLKDFGNLAYIHYLLYFSRGTRSSENSKALIRRLHIASLVKRSGLKPLFVISDPKTKIESKDFLLVPNSSDQQLV